MQRIWWLDFFLIADFISPQGFLLLRESSRAQGQSDIKDILLTQIQVTSLNGSILQKLLSQGLLSCNVTLQTHLTVGELPVIQPDLLPSLLLASLHLKSLSVVFYLNQILTIDVVVFLNKKKQKHFGFFLVNLIFAHTWYCRPLLV